MNFKCYIYFAKYYIHKKRKKNIYYYNKSMHMYMYVHTIDISYAGVIV